MSCVIVWFRQDLRLADNPALAHAVATGQPVLCLYILDDETPGAWPAGAASRWWLHQSLQALGAELAEIGGSLVLRCGRADAVVPALIAETDASAVFWNACYEPWSMVRDAGLKTALGEKNVP